MVVWSMDALCVSTSLDLHNARLVLLYIPQWDADLENSHTALHDFRTRLKKIDIAAEGTQLWTFVKKVSFLQKHISVPLNGLPMIIWQN